MVRTVPPAAGAQAWPGPGNRQASPLSAPSLPGSAPRPPLGSRRAHRGPAGDGSSKPPRTHHCHRLRVPHFTRLSLRRTPSLGCLRPVARHVTEGHQPHVTTPFPLLPPPLLWPRPSEAPPTKEGGLETGSLCPALRSRAWPVWLTSGGRGRKICLPLLQPQSCHMMSRTLWNSSPDTPISSSLGKFEGLRRKLGLVREACPCRLAAFRIFAPDLT